MSKRLIPGWVVLSFSLLFLLFLSSAASAQVSFQTVVSPGPASFEVEGVSTPFIIKDGDTYKMWYTGQGVPPSPSGPPYQYNLKIGYAESSDGVSWVSRQMVHSAGEGWTYAGRPSVIKQGGIYEMWHEDYYEVVAGDWSSYISHMTSTDGINWASEQKVLSGGGDFVGWDGYNARDPFVKKEADGTYTIYYTILEHHQVGAAGPANIARATSSNGINWGNKQLVLATISSSGWEYNLYGSQVVREADGTYTMYYHGPGPFHAGGGYWTIGRAKSTDRIVWTDRRPILSVSQLGSDILDVSYPFYFRDTDGTEYLYFTFVKSVPGSYYGARSYIGRVRLLDLQAPQAPSGNTPVGSPVEVNFGGGLKVVFSNVTNRGDTSYVAIPTLPGGPPSGFQFQGKAYDILTTATYSGNITVVMPYDPATLRQWPRLFHWNGSKWQDITTSIDGTNHTITGTVSSLSPFVVGDPVPVVGYTAPWFTFTMIFLMTAGGFLLLRPGLTQERGSGP